MNGCIHCIVAYSTSCHFALCGQGTERLLVEIMSRDIGADATNSCGGAF